MAEENQNLRPPYDPELVVMSDYLMDYEISSPLAWETAKYCLLDSLGCAMLALSFGACTKLLGPYVPGMHIDQGARVPGTSFELDPIKAAFDIGTMIRWLDYNDTWLAAEWGHPSDNLGGILSVMDFVSRRQIFQKCYTVKDILDAMIRAYEIQGVLALSNSFNQVGLDHVVLVKIASCGVVAKLIGANKTQIVQALSQAWIDGQSLRTYRHAPNTGSRKSWAAGDATSRGVRLAMLTLQGENGYPSALSAKRWGFNEVCLHGKPLTISQPLGCYVMENILFKIAYPAEFHAQTAVECALNLYPKVKERLHEIDKIKINTQNAAMRIINKTGLLYNPADRDHCLQFMVANALAKGELNAQSYEDENAQDPMIHNLRDKMFLQEDPQFSQDYLDPSKRSIANRLEIYFKNGETLSHLCEYPLGHRARRKEGLPLLWQKFERNLLSIFSKDKTKQLVELFHDDKTLLPMKVNDFISLWVAK
ncbi:MAG: bifunctional 2-methylcitrate dehydratase/aconitate hydratase [Proteobacteria bacterium]|nr:bifunctional 2-methylcitrate dehydratase/aconitate hydratase [Pseudomonadota bacterium]